MSAQEGREVPTIEDCMPTRDEQKHLRDLAWKLCEGSDIDPSKAEQFMTNAFFTGSLRRGYDG